MFVDGNMRNEYMLSGNLATKRPDVVVALDGSGNYRTVPDAVSAALKLAKPETRFVIYVKSGVYTENKHGGDEFMAQDMTFRNTVGPDAGQAVAFLSGSDHSAFYHCSFEGYQDTLYAFEKRQFYKEYQIFETVDFIFGNALAFFQDCEIFVRKPLDGGGLVVTAQGRSTENEATGFSFQGCKITAGEDLKPVLSQYNKAFFGRPWRPHALTVYMESYFDDIVDPQGWLDTWGFNETCFLGEYNNYGPGSSTLRRVKWPNFHNITDR
ncbi:hypothetical protein OSB04_008119 [Centaurea solstitialis]|uniref:Pectinesterase catalytic domain-containing protein n=1 Tax=Centaurea solstitialis TaxID=347529 RepID=A0AA38TMW1_9ASTR|nr:hypothetical protein OSB04_008119 [Centaurea solstitialis]